MEEITSIREMIRVQSERLRYPEQLSGDDVSAALVTLSSLLSSLNREIGEKRYWYNVKLQQLRTEKQSAADAKIAGEASTEWKEWNERALQKEALIELIRSLKYHLKNLTEERKEAIY